MNTKTLLGLFFAMMLGASCSQQAENSEATNAESSKQEIKAEKQRIVTLNGAVTEIVATAGFASEIVGVDVTSTYPVAIAQLPKVGYNMNIPAEGILSLEPTLVIGNEGNLKPEVITQLGSTGLEVSLLPEREYTVEATKSFIKEVCAQLGNTEAAGMINKGIDSELDKVEPLAEETKVLFIYSRGAGTSMVAGDETQMKAIIELAGAKNAVEGFEGFKPLTPEALVAANPDAVLMFNSGVASLEGNEGVLAIPGMNQTTAGKNGNIISMDGPFISNFGPRLGAAAFKLNQILKDIKR